MGHTGRTAARAGRLGKSRRRANGTTGGPAAACIGKGIRMRGDERTSASVREANENGRVFLELSERLLADDLATAERAHLLRLWRQLRDAAARETRAAVASRLLDHPAPPPDLLIAVAEDDPAIAAPLLRDAPFRPEELIALIARTGPAHHIEIAKRADLTLDVWLALARAATTRRSSATAADASPTQAAPPPSRRPVPPRRPAPPPPPSPAPLHKEETASHPHQPLPQTVHPPSGPTARKTDRAGPSIRPSRDSQEQNPTISRSPASRRDWRVLEDPAADSWAFQTDRAGIVVALSPLAESAFGRPLSALAGRRFEDLLAEAAPAPGPAWIAEALRERRVIRDAVVEILPRDGAPARRWRIRARPQFSFPEGRFLGYAGTARDLDRLARPRSERPAIPELLDRMADAADRLARATEDPQLEDYARTLGELARSLKAAVAEHRAHDHDPFDRPDRDF